jgi:RNA polymerase sigma-70 factor, ECF subfamily
VRSLCLSLLSNPSEAEDAAQDAFLKAYLSLNDFRGEAAFSTWLYRIAFRHCQDLLRKRTRRKTDSWDDLLDKHGAALEGALSSPGQAASAENADLVRRLLSAMPEDYAAVLTLREMQGLSYQEMTEVLDCSLDSVKARLRRARQWLTEKARPLL